MPRGPAKTREQLIAETEAKLAQLKEDNNRSEELQEEFASRAASIVEAATEAGQAWTDYQQEYETKRDEIDATMKDLSAKMAELRKECRGRGIEVPDALRVRFGRDGKPDQIPHYTVSRTVATPPTA